MRTRLQVLAATATLPLASLAIAADLPKEGSYDVLACFTQTISRLRFDNAHRAWSYEETATATGTTPGGLFDGDKVRCVGFGAIDDGKRSGTAYCEGIAPNGDTRLTRFWYDAEGKVQRAEIAGTGRYQGLVTVGTVRPEGAPEEKVPGTVTYCNRLQGTYRMP